MLSTGFRILGDRSTGPFYILTSCLSSQGMRGVDGVQGSKGNIVSMVHDGDSGPCNKDPTMNNYSLSALGAFGRNRSSGSAGKPRDYGMSRGDFYGLNTRIFLSLK